MKIMIVGDWKMPHYEQAVADGFAHAGHKVVPFRVTDFLDSSFFARVEKKLLIGPRLQSCNLALLQSVETQKPDVILFFKPLYIFESTAARIRRGTRCLLISQCNDNPYEDGERFRLWRHYHRVVQQCDLNFYSRPSDLEFAKREHVPNPQWLKFYYVEGLHRTVEQVAPEFRNDVVFVGHYEPDGRDEVLEYLLANHIPLRVYGPEWHRAPRHKYLSQQSIAPLSGSDYVQALSGAKIALVFLSTRNKDLYTTRCFEIPACGTMMIAPRNSLLREMYDEDAEAVYFQSPQELLQKLQYYLAHPDERKGIASAGRIRCLSGRNSNSDRAQEILRAIGELRPDLMPMAVHA